MISLKAEVVASDFLGFYGTTKEERCRSFHNALICGDIQPNVYLFYLFPRADHLCPAGPGTIFKPYMLVAVDLPTNDTIHGFVFVGDMLAGDTLASYEEDLEKLVGPTQDMVGPSNVECDEEEMAIFDSQMQELAQRIRLRTLDPETLANIDDWFQLAQSIKVRER